MDIEKYKKYIKNDVELLSVEKRKNRTVITIKCKKCGVIPLLYKLSEGRIYEKKHELKELRQTVLQ